MIKLRKYQSYFLWFWCWWIWINIPWINILCNEQNLVLPNKVYDIVWKMSPQNKLNIYRNWNLFEKAGHSEFYRSIAIVEISFLQWNLMEAYSFYNTIIWWADTTNTNTKIQIEWPFLKMYKFFWSYWFKIW